MHETDWGQPRFPQKKTNRLNHVILSAQERSKNLTEKLPFLFRRKISPAVVSEIALCTLLDMPMACAYHRTFRDNEKIWKNTAYA